MIAPVPPVIVSPVVVVVKLPIVSAFCFALKVDQLLLDRAPVVVPLARPNDKTCEPSTESPLAVALIVIAG